MRKRNGGIELCIRDDGVGFDPAAAREQGGGLGLRGMEERAERLDAALSISSRPGEGTCVRVDVLLQERTER